jgi:hypothetical protein
MNRNRSITIIRATLALSVILSLAVPMFAHGGFDHVMGTVVKLADHVLTVKTTKGNVVDVKLDEKTELTKNGAKASMEDLKRGVHVVVDIPEGNKEKLAHSVKIGVAGATSHDAHQ